MERSIVHMDLDTFFVSCERLIDSRLDNKPVLIGGTMGTCSYVLTGTEKGMTETFGTTCHGAVSSPVCDEVITCWTRDV